MPRRARARRHHVPMKRHPIRAAEQRAEAAAAEAQAARHLPDGLLRSLRSDPLHAAEHIALAAADWHGPAAAAWAADRRALYGPVQLGKIVKRKHASYARLGGAATGIGGIWTAVPDLASLAWVQSRLVFFMAAAYGYDPTDRMRPAELLVLQRVYPDAESARAGLDKVGTSLAMAYVDSKLAQATDGQRDSALLTSLLKFVGLRYGAKTAGRWIPGLAILTNAVGNERDTRALADRAIAYYGGGPPAPTFRKRLKP